jgi:hypothetical protein
MYEALFFRSASSSYCRKPDGFTDIIFNQIAVNEENSPAERCVKDIELYFDASKNNTDGLSFVHFPALQPLLSHLAIAIDTLESSA